MHRNRPVFVARWAEVLAERPASFWPASPQRVLAARDAPAGGRVLVAGAEAVLPARCWRGVPQRLRVTLIGGAPAWRDRGVEVLDGPIEAVLRAPAAALRRDRRGRGRRARGARPPELQPLAALVSPAEACSSADALLARAGIA